MRWKSGISPSCFEPSLGNNALSIKGQAEILAERGLMFRTALEVTSVTLRAQLTNMFREKRAGVSVKEKGERRPIC